MELKYTARVVNEIEVESKKPFLEAVMEYSMKTVSFLVRKGLGKTKEEMDIVYRAIDDYMLENPEENSLETLWGECLKSLQSAGFLAKSVNIEQMIWDIKHPEEAEKRKREEAKKKLEEMQSEEVKVEITPKE